MGAPLTAWSPHLDGPIHEAPAAHVHSTPTTNIRGPSSHLVVHRRNSPGDRARKGEGLRMAPTAGGRFGSVRPWPQGPTPLHGEGGGHFLEQKVKAISKSSNMKMTVTPQTKSQRAACAGAYARGLHRMAGRPLSATSILGRLRSAPPYTPPPSGVPRTHAQCTQLARTPALPSATARPGAPAQ